ncbi:hypothetical protein N7481_011317, partial [Penicillium waksmanii]|uniref:uncharacterized protein n=1 Tax=Penicillium waksmanii TaxID=69791 RepID=UPI00254920B2
PFKSTLRYYKKIYSKRHPAHFSGLLGELSQCEELILQLASIKCLLWPNNWNYGLGGLVDGVLREYISVPAQAVVKTAKS